MVNEFLKKQQQIQRGMLEVGIAIGFQKCWDLVQIALRDKEAVGRDTFGIGRIKKLYTAMVKWEHELGNAWLETQEADADVCQRDLDALLGEIWGDELCPFYERYPEIKRGDYKKGSKQWKK